MARRHQQGLPAQVQPPVVIISRPVEVRKFYGDSDDTAVLQEFECQIKRAYEELNNPTNERKINLIIDNVGPEVRAEIRCLDPNLALDPEVVLQRIRSVFGEKRSPSRLLQVLLNIRQEEGESIRKYSYRLNEAYDGLIRRQASLGEASTPCAILRDHFVSGLRDLTLRSYMRERMHQVRMDFREVREIAIRWDAESSASPVMTMSVAENRKDVDAMAEKFDKRLEKLERRFDEFLSGVGNSRLFGNKGINDRGQKV